jgi:endonuclease-3
MKKGHNLPVMWRRIEKAIAPFPKAALFELYERGFTTLFEQLAACIISIRTLDETTIPVSLRLFGQARTPAELLRLSPSQLEGLLYGTTFPGQKAYTLLGIARTAEDTYGGHLPAHFEILTALKGVGPKCANLALGIAGGQEALSVDIHVHRITNRWGLVHTGRPEDTMAALQAIVPKEDWIKVNRLLVPFGKHICTGRRPKCPVCPVLEYCQQVGVVA